MVDAALVYVVSVVVLFFFWIYGVVAFLRDVKNWLVSAYRQWRDEEAGPAIGVDERRRASGADGPSRHRDVDE